MTALLNPFWYAPTGDPSFASVVLLLHLDGTNGSTTFTDNSASAHSFTPTGTISLTTAQKQFGTASLQCGAAGSAVGTGNSADWWFDAGRFTIEMWIRPTATVSGVRVLIGQFQSSVNLGWDFVFNGTTLAFFYSTTGTDNPNVGGTYSPTVNQWVHIAVDRDASSVLRVYANGVVIGSGTVTASFYHSTVNLYIGNDGNLTREFQGQIDEVRITKGVARYGGAFTPPTAAFPNS